MALQSLCSRGQVLPNFAVFLYLAYGSLDYIGGQIIGKTWMVLVALPVIHIIRSRGALVAVGTRT